MLLPLLLVAPWVALALFVAFAVRLPPELPAAVGLRDAAGGPGGDAGSAGESRDDGGPRPEPSRVEIAWPSVSVVVPARNEEHNIERVLRSLAASRYPTFDVVVVDDRSEDRTAELARAVGRGGATRLEVLDGEPLPEGWMGKPWACWQGGRAARGELLLFTDADTVHAPDLLERSVRSLVGEDAGAVTVVGRQIVGSFWERVVQPHVFLSMVLRYFDAARPFGASRWRSAIANGQYILFRRRTYDELGGHGRVRGEVAEDLRLAQELVRDGHRLLLRKAEDGLATRMYRSLGDLVAGWSKNVVLGGLQTLPPWLRPVTPPAMVLSAVGLWLVPPLVLLAGLVGAVGAGWTTWAAVTVTVSALFWCGVSRRFGAPWAYGFLYPLGAGVAAWIFLRSWVRMGRVEWKGRSYRVAKP